MSDTATTTSNDETVEAPQAESAASAAPAEQADAPAKKGMSRKGRIRLFVILGLAVLVGLAFLARYLIDTSNYTTTDNAQVDGNQISINAPTSGTLLDWRGQVGAPLRANAAVGRIKMQGGYVQPQMVIRAPTRTWSTEVSSTRAVTNTPCVSYATASCVPAVT